MLSEVNVKASIQCHYSWSCQEKRAEGFSSKRKKRLVQNSEDGVLTHVSVYTFVGPNALLCCRIRALLLHQKTLFILASHPGGSRRVPARGRPKSPRLSRCSGDDGKLSAMQRSTHVLSSSFMHTCRPRKRSRKGSARCGTHATFTAFLPQ